MRKSKIDLSMIEDAMEGLNRRYEVVSVQKQRF